MAGARPRCPPGGARLSGLVRVPSSCPPSPLLLLSSSICHSLSLLCRNIARSSSPRHRAAAHTAVSVHPLLDHTLADDARQTTTPKTYHTHRLESSMAPRTRKAAASSSPAPQNGDTPPPPPPKDDAPATPSIGVDALLVPVTGEVREVVKVNNASASDMKHACDDALKRVRVSSFPLRCMRVLGRGLGNGGGCGVLLVLSRHRAPRTHHRPLRHAVIDKQSLVLVACVLGTAHWRLHRSRALCCAPRKPHTPILLSLASQKGSFPSHAQLQPRSLA